MKANQIPIFQEVKELETLASRDTPADNREYFKNEIALAIRDIKNEYDAIAQQNKQDQESWYKLKVFGWSKITFKIINF